MSANKAKSDADPKENASADAGDENKAPDAPKVEEGPAIAEGDSGAPSIVDPEAVKAAAKPLEDVAAPEIKSEEDGVVVLASPAGAFVQELIEKLLESPEDYKAILIGAAVERILGFFSQLGHAEKEALSAHVAANFEAELAKAMDEKFEAALEDEKVAGKFCSVRGVETASVTMQGHKAVVVFRKDGITSRKERLLRPGKKLNVTISA